MGEPPRGQQGSEYRLREAKRGASGRGKWRQIQARGAGRRDEQRIMTGGRCGKCPGGRRSTPGEELGSGCYIEVLRRRKAADWGAVGGEGYL